MSRKNLVYICSLRNAAADRAGQYVEYKGGQRYMKSPLQYLVEALNTRRLGEVYSLVGVVYDDDENLLRDKQSLGQYGFAPESGKDWFHPADLTVQGKRVNDMLYSVPSCYRGLPMDAAQRKEGKHDFEMRLQNLLIELKADVVILDGLLVILDELVRPGSRFHRRIFNIHPGITRIESPFERRGAYGTLDALYGARGEQVVNWDTMEKIAVPAVMKTGASFHYVDNGIDSGEVVADYLFTDIDPDDTILEMRWNNFNNSLFPAIYEGLMIVSADSP